jgi:hypothetical protein
MKKLLASGLALLLLALAGLAQAQEEAGEQFHNPRFGFTLTIPSGHTSLLLPENGDGVTALYREGMELRAYGSLSPLVFSRNCKALYEEAKEGFDEITYSRLNEAKGWFVLSGYREGKIRYLKQFVGREATNAVDMVYPKEHARKFDGFVNTVVRSFVPGSLDIAP